MKGKPLFLGRQGYRARRLRDAARLLPVLGLGLVLLPVMWAPAAGAVRATVGDAIYLFVVWLVLIVAAALFGRGLTREDEGDDAL
jgi:hypothetical protein